MLPLITITVPSFSVLAFTGGFFAFILVYFRAKKLSVRLIDLLKLFALSAICAYVGATFVFMLTRIPWLVTHFSFRNLLYLITRSGIVFYGGLFGVLLAAKLFARFCRYDEAATYRMIVPAIPLFHAFGRIGCLLGGCCFGRVLATVIEFDGVLFTRMPVQAFEAAFCFLLFSSLMIIEKKRREWDLLRTYMLSYAAFRFAIEFLRGDNLRGVYILSTSQWISLAIIAYYIFKWVRNRRRNVKDMEEAP